jgi:predicted nucleic acid-binding protein
MLVVADSSPLIVLVNIGLVDILPKLFRLVLIPREIAAELNRPSRPQAVRSFIISAPDRLLQQSPAGGG